MVNTRRHAHNPQYDWLGSMLSTNLLLQRDEFGTLQ